MGGAKSGKKDPPPHGEGEGIRWLYQAPKAVCPTILLEWLEDSRLSSMRLPPTQSSGGISLLWANDHQQDAQMPAIGMLQRDAVVQALMVEPLLVNMESSTAPESRKHTQEDTNMYRKSVGDSTLKENSYVQRTHDITSICLRRHLGLSCCCSTNVRPTIPHVSLSVSGSGRTTSCWSYVTGSPIKAGPW